MKLLTKIDSIFSKIRLIIKMFSAVRLEKLHVLRGTTRKNMEVHLNGIVYCVPRPPKFLIDTVEPPPQKPRQAPNPRPTRRHRKKVIKIRGRNLRRPKRARKASQIRTIDIIDEPITVPNAFLTPKEEEGE